MTTYYQEPQPVRKIPSKGQREPLSNRQQPITHHTGTAGFHPEEDEEDILDEKWPSRLPTSARRYQEYEISPEHVYTSGNTRYHVRYVDVPKRTSSRPKLQPPEREVYTDEIEQLPPQQSGIRLHPVACFGIFCVLLVVGWIGLNVVTSWYQGVKDDWTYGTQRHFEINGVVGHNDSSSHPSHFTAENDNGQIIVIELPGGDVSHAKIYQIETVPGNAGNPPVKLTFQDMNADGKPDMLVQIGDTNAAIYVTLFNSGSQFVSKL